MRRAPEGQRQHARGCLLGQLAGDSLGSLVEFQTAQQIRDWYPDGVRLLADGGTWNTIAGQPTDDSEMALALARMLLEHGTYVQDAARDAYREWLDSVPFDLGMTTFNGLKYRPDHESQANGALMRISPLGIFGANRPAGEVAEWAKRDAAITHPNRNCVDINALFVMAIAHVVSTPATALELYEMIGRWSLELPVSFEVQDVIRAVRRAPPDDYITHQGWVLIAFQNALWQLLHATSLEEAWSTRSCAAAIPTPMPPSAVRCLAPFTATRPFRPNGRLRSWPVGRKRAGWVSCGPGHRSIGQSTRSNWQMSLSKVPEIGRRLAGMLRAGARG